MKNCVLMLFIICLCNTSALAASLAIPEHNLLSNPVKVNDRSYPSSSKIFSASEMVSVIANGSDLSLVAAERIYSIIMDYRGTLKDSKEVTVFSFGVWRKVVSHRRVSAVNQDGHRVVIPKNIFQYMIRFQPDALFLSSGMLTVNQVIESGYVAEISDAADVHKSQGARALVTLINFMKKRLQYVHSIDIQYVGRFVKSGAGSGTRISYTPTYNILDTLQN